MRRLSRCLDDLDVVLSDHRHPDKGAARQHKGEDLGQTQFHALKDKQLAGKVSERHDVGPDSYVVDGAEMQIVGGVATDDAGDEGPGAEQAAGEGGHLVRGVGGVGGREDELVDRVFGVKVGRGGRQLGVADEAAVVKAAGEVQRRVSLEGVAYGDDGELRDAGVSCRSDG